MREAIIIGGGLAGLSAAIYLGRARRDVLVIDAGHSMAVWEPDVQNYLGFPEGISGEALLERGREQAIRFDAKFVEDRIVETSGRCGEFVLKGDHDEYRARRLIIATGLTHLPPEIPGVKECLGHSMFFCKDCDGYRVQGKTLVIMGATDDAVEYALSMLMYSPKVYLVTNGEEPRWDECHAKWMEEYEIPYHTGRVVSINHEKRQIKGLCFEGGRELAADYLFTVRGDAYHNGLAISLGAAVDADGQVEVDHCMQTSVKGLYAAGCVTPANCQMVIAAGQGARAAQAINRDLFEEDIATHALRRFRQVQVRTEATLPEVVE
ncbi:MAG: putative Thioredoxin-disulfide reductase [Cyanobacteria bacterium RYN_339]|nr:putative Thioredoxin-disulfide reductase [Cyanobacteria bacterium RYN_339]